MLLPPGSWLLRSLSQRRSFLLRIDPAVLEAVQRWADDDLRSLNGQIEFLLKEAVLRRKHGIARETGAPGGKDTSGRPAD